MNYFKLARDFGEIRSRYVLLCSQNYLIFLRGKCQELCLQIHFWDIIWTWVIICLHFNIPGWHHCTFGVSSGNRRCLWYGKVYLFQTHVSFILPFSSIFIYIHIWNIFFSAFQICVRFSRQPPETFLCYTVFHSSWCYYRILKSEIQYRALPLNVVKFQLNTKYICSGQIPCAL